MSAPVAAGFSIVAKTGEAAKSGPLGLALILVLCVACYFLFKSMSKHLKRVREQFPTDPPASEVEPVNAAEVPPAPAPVDEKASPPTS